MNTSVLPDDKLISVLKVQAFKYTSMNRVLAYEIKLENLKQVAPILGYINDEYKVVLDRSLTKDEQVVVLIHETLHDVLDHIKRGLRLEVFNQQHDQVLWNLATDYVVNKIILSLNLKKHPEILKNVIQAVDKLRPDPTSDTSAEALYRLLKNKTEVQVEELEVRIPGQNQNQEQGQGQGQGQDQDQGQKEPDSIKIVKTSIVNKETGEVLQESVQVLISKEEAQERSESQQEGKQVDIFKLQESLKQAGDSSSLILQEITAAKSRLSLKNELSSYFENFRIQGTDVSFFASSPRSIVVSSSCGYKIPSFVNPRSRILVAIDSSGSISDKEYSEFLGVLRRNLKYICGKLVLFDTDVQVYDLDSRALETLERRGTFKRVFCGGTSLQETFKIIEQEKFKLAVIMTDLEVEIPEKPKKLSKVVWVVPSIDGVKLPDYGKVIQV